MDLGSFDYVIIGGGTAGCLLANRLSESPANRVLLLEAGKRDTYPWIHIPAGYLYCIGNPRTDWCFETTACRDLGDRSMKYARGKGLGGCSSINGMVYTFLFALVIGGAYLRQAHVRIDLIRDFASTRRKYWIEIFGIAAFLLPYAILGGWYCFTYTQTSFLSGEASKSTIGLTNVWIPKAALVAMFALMGLAGLSQLLKCVAGLTGALPGRLVAGALGSDR